LEANLFFSLNDDNQAKLAMPKGKYSKSKSNSKSQKKKAGKKKQIDFSANAAKSKYYFSAGNMPHKFALGTCNFHRAHRSCGNFPVAKSYP